MHLLAPRHMTRAGVHAAPVIRDSRFRDRAAWWRYTRHLVEMVVAMVAGMFVMGVAFAAVGNPPGYETLLGMYAYMGAAMSAPMVAWMRRRGHSWADCWEMTASMVLPMFALVLPVALGLEKYVPGLSAGSLMLLAHVAMLGGMALLMLYRWDRYAGEAHCHVAATPVSTLSPAAPQSDVGHTETVADPVCGVPVDPAAARNTAE